MISVIPAHEAPHHREAFRRWCIDEWGNDDALRQPQTPLEIPEALFAVAGEQLVGGLVFTVYASPASGEPAHWINAVVVLPQWRRRGIASALIRAAVPAVLDAGGARVFALTDVPDLYRKLGWSVVRETGEGTVLSIRVSAARRVPPDRH